MSRWFRFYSEAMRDPKVAGLSDPLFRLWMDLLCVASDNDGLIPPLDDLKHILRRRLDHLSRGLDDLIRARLMVSLEYGYKPNGWDKRQYKSDTSTDRVAKHREKRNVSETSPDTETESDTDAEVAKATKPRTRKVHADKPDGIDGSVWSDFLKQRKTPFTQTALAGFQREADQAGFTLTEALAESCARGWQGFKADWVKGNGNGRQNGNQASGRAIDRRDGLARVLDRQLGIDDPFDGSAVSGGEVGSRGTVARLGSM